jgi:hypothetical protein
MCGGRFSGFSSGSVLSGPDVRTFFAFTIPLIRAICYSIGAYISALGYHAKVSLSRSSVPFQTLPLRGAMGIIWLLRNIPDI